MNDPLSPELWFQRLHYIADQFSSNPEENIERFLRHMVHLAQLAPGPLRDLSRPRIDENSFEFLVAAENYDAASFGLIADLATCSIRYDEQSRIFSAAIGLPALAITVELMADTAARAVLTAWVQCYLAVYAAYGGKLKAIGDALQHTDQSAQRRPPTEH